MDDETNRQYSRAPEIEDLTALCRSLNTCGVKYILIGGFAIILHGFVRGTKDIDLLVDPSIDNVKKIKRALSFLPDNVISLIKEDEIEKFSVVRVADEFVIDLMANACGVDFEKAWKSIEYILVEGVEIPVPSMEMLIQMKNTLRPSDQMDVEFLKLSLEEMNRRKKRNKNSDPKV